MDIEFEVAQEQELSQLIQLLIDDHLGAKRESRETSMDNYRRAFKAIDEDPNNELIVAKDDSNVAALLQLTYLPSLTYQGAWRCQVEGVRVAADYRSQGLGKKLFQWSIQRAEAKGCKIIQLTSDKGRPDAIRFYESLGFKASHEGMKLHLK